MRQARHYQKSKQERKDLQKSHDFEVIAILQRAKERLSNCGIQQPLFEAELILSHLLNVERHNLYIEPLHISKEIKYKFFYLIARRANRIPLAYLLKKIYFYGLEFYISKGVFIPRPETESIIVCATQLIKDKSKKVNILDICTGCGILAICLAKVFPFSKVIATDISKKAVNIARRNVFSHKLQKRVKVLRSDIVPKNLCKKFSLIVSNPPYLTADEIEQADEEVKKEPICSLYGGENGMRVIDKILQMAPDFLERDGFLIMEVSPSQIQYFRELKNTGLSLISIYKDICG
ncbi:MAG: peptide chain release factor N(5)-glutamine methyltransferase, partial [Candidatus Omnitrophica bacterium]|nr:peptide chain release factor N(5)-glutamine methyltransferase [Candidatus Omnitrophota bacterium]